MGQHVRSGSVVCPDGVSLCPDNNACCRTADSHWGCCSLPDAVCCSDGNHCCPKGTKCDPSHGTCITGDNKFSEVLWSKKTKARKATGQDILQAWGIMVRKPCPDGHTVCSVDRKCCRSDDGSYHCCQHDVGVMCPDHVHMCPTDNTCCRMFYQGQWMWGCCPDPNAVCCDDGQHCCPSGYRCNNNTCMCVKGSNVFNWHRYKP